MRFIQHSPDAHSISSALLFRSYQHIYLPEKTVNDIFQVSPGWLFLLGEFLGKASWLQSIVQTRNPEFQLVIRSFVSSHGLLKVSYGTINADFMEDSVLTDMVFSLEQRASHTCENTGSYGELCQREGLFRTLSFEEAKKSRFTPCNPRVAEQWELRLKNT